MELVPATEAVDDHVKAIEEAIQADKMKTKTTKTNKTNKTKTNKTKKAKELEKPTKGVMFIEESDEE